MPESRILVGIRGDVIALPLDSRDRLVDELRRRDDGDDVIAAFEAVTPGRLVELDVLGQVVAVEAIRQMESEGSLPDGLRDLLAALVDELHEHE